MRRFLSKAGSRLVLGFFAVALTMGAAWGIAKGLGLPDFVATLLGALGSTGVYVALVRSLENRAVTELDPKKSPEVLTGLLLGALLFSTTIGILWLLGSYKVEGTGPMTALLGTAAAAALGGIGEEILLRGVVYRITEELVGTWGSLAISALLFGLLHLPNPNATLIGALAIALEAGILLAAAYLVTRRLWLAIGLHIGWNFTQGGIFGVAISGHEAKGLLHGTLIGPDWLSGGAFGAEASPVAVAVCLAAAIPMLVLAAKRRQWKPAPWRKPESP